MQYASRFFELGEARTGVYNLLVTHVCSVWQNNCLASGPENILHSLETHFKLITQACLFGPVHKKNLRSERLQACLYASKTKCPGWWCFYLHFSGQLRMLNYLSSLWKESALQTACPSGRLCFQFIPKI